MNDIYQDNLLQERQGASPALTPSGCAQADIPKGTKRNPACRGEKTRGRRGRLSAHSVFVIGKEGEPMTPTTPARARKLLRDGVAKKAVWISSNFFMRKEEAAIPLPAKAGSPLAV